MDICWDLGSHQEAKFGCCEADRLKLLSRHVSPPSPLKQSQVTSLPQTQFLSCKMSLDSHCTERLILVHSWVGPILKSAPILPSCSRRPQHVAGTERPRHQQCGRQPGSPAARPVPAAATQPPPAAPHATEPQQPHGPAALHGHRDPATELPQ